MRADGAKLYNDGLIVENGPTDVDIAASEKLGRDFAASIDG